MNTYGDQMLGARSIQDFLKGKKAVILDQSRTSRNTVETALTNLGVESTCIASIKNFSHAKGYIAQHKPEIIITEFQIDSEFGLDLVQVQEEYTDNFFDRIFIVITNNAQDSAVADAAEEQVDSYILKPLTQDVVQEYIKRIIQLKLHPSEYVSIIGDAKKLIQDGEYDNAKSLLVMAKLMDERPTIAHYYLGQVLEREGDLVGALEEFREGLKINPIHFKCLVGEFTVLNEQQELDEAYQALKNISTIFPLTPQLLRQAFLLSIYTYSYQDVEKYYEMYLKVPRKSAELKHVVSQGLLTAGKFLLNEQRLENALDYFKKGAVINGRTPEFLHNVINALLKNNSHSECEAFIQMFDVYELGTNLYKQLDFRVKSHLLHPESILKLGRDMVYQGIADEYVYKIVLDLLVEQGQVKMVESIVYKGVNQYPNLRSELLVYMEKIKKAG